MATPTIPPRPSRTQNVPPSGGNMDFPKIPPRPKRGVERSVSPHRDAYARSPLNELPGLHKPLSNNHSSSNLSVEVPARPPSVTLPSIGQEGNEYASLEDLHKVPTLDGSPQQTSNVAGDLPLHAPKASVPSSTAKRQIQTVTRTDSSQAAAVIGKLLPEQKSAHAPDSGRSDASSGGRTRPTSMIKDEDEHGIPEIGVQVPMYPNAGDVQAPTPSPYDQAPSVGVGFFNKGGQSGGRHHGRTKSGREIFHGPPGSYGLHGHGIIPKDDFEKKWYEKHPEDLRREKAGEYGPHIQENRKDYHWVGDDLVKLVHSSGSKRVGLGTSREAIGTPDEHIGYIASEEYASRMASPRPASGRPASVHVDSPLKQQDFPADQLSRQQTHESEAEEEVIHIDPPSHRASKVGGGGYDPPTEDFGPEGGNTEEEGGWVNERGYGVPILASDETRKNPGAEYRQPAVSPELERRAEDYTANDPDGTPSYVTKYRSTSRSSSRTNSVHGMPALSRVISPQEHHRSGTPLESTKEYEPLFPDEEEREKKPKSAVDKFKRPELARHHFPSQDVWEDTPSSLLHETTVETPQAPEEPQSPGEEKPSQVFEAPESEEARKDDITKEDQQSFLPEHTKRLAKSHLNKEHLAAPTRSGMQQRFPSHDIWEDAPDHGHLETTVSGPQEEDTGEYLEDSPVVERPSVPARPNIPARPQKAKEQSPVDKKAPLLPDRPKPQIPTRPAKSIATKSSERVPTAEADSSAVQPKAKPGVPPRPAGSKIAALQSSFLKDLNSKLGLGPQAPKVKEPEPEKEEEPPKPLQDARKGRAKGPQRRKPASSPTPAAATITAEVAVPPRKLEISTVSTIWSIGDDGVVDAPAAQIAAKISSALRVPERKESMEKIEDTDVDVARDIAGKSEAIEPDEENLAKVLTADSEVSQSSKAVGLEEDPETHVPSLEKKNSLDIPLESGDALVKEKSEPQDLVSQGIERDEPSKEKAELAEAAI